MDTARFDTLTRSLHDARSRRGTLAIVLGGALGLLGLAQPDDAAAKSGTCKPKCGECKTCKKGDCKKKDGKTVCKKGKCQATALGTTCSVGTCQGGVCTAPPPPPPDPNACATSGCAEHVCGPAGSHCICVGPPAGPGRCVRSPTEPVPPPPCSATGTCAPGLQCTPTCGGPRCIRPCV